MSGISLLSDITGQLPQAVPGLTRQVNRMAVTIEQFRTEVGDGKNFAHDIELDGAAAASYHEGDDVQDSEFNVDAFQLALLSWAHYRSSFKISETQLNAAMSSRAGFSELGRFFYERLRSSITKLASVMNRDCISGTGTDGSGNPNLVGLTGAALLATGSYAGIDRGNFPLWKGNVLGNGGIKRPLSVDLLNQGESNIFYATGLAPNMVITGPSVFRKYQSLFEVIRRVDGQGPIGRYDTSTVDVFYMGMPVIRDKDWDDVAPNSLAILNQDHMLKKYLPEMEQGVLEGEEVEQVLAFGDNGEQVVNMLGLPFKVFSLAKTGDSYKVVVKSVLNQLVTRPGSCCLITDLAV